MPYAKQKGDPNHYFVIAADCLGCECFRPGLYQHRGAVGSAGSQNTGQSSATCMRNAYHGCPDEGERGYSDERKVERKREGWKVLL